MNSFIEKVLFKSNENIKKHQSKFLNNLVQKQRIALESVTKNKSIVIILSDKNGSIVVSDKEEYEQAYFNIFIDANCYEELNENPNTS